jgi:acyl-coenzyme A synthetase/AMP-(fatty) acid ligase
MSLVTEKQANTAVAIDRSISDNKGDQLALRYREKRYSYNDLAALMNRAGNMLKRLGVGLGDQIVVAVSASPSLVASVLGAMKIGATSIVVPVGTSGQAIPLLGNAKLLIVEAPRLAEFGDVKVKHLVVGDASEGQPSFLQEMRTSSSSLGRLSDIQDSAALGVTGPGGVIWFTHDQIANSDAKLGQNDIGRILVHLTRGEDVTLT